MENLKNISPFRLSSLLRLQKNPNLALQLFQNPNPNSSPKPFRYSFLSYNLIISKLARAKMFDEMEQILLQMKHEIRFSPKESLFCNIISFYGRSRSPDRALATFDRIPTFNCYRTVRALNSLLNALLKCRNLEKIREIRSHLDRYASPDACTYNILINASCLSNSLDDAWNLFDEMRRKGIRPNVVTFGTLVSALCRNSMLDEAFRLKKKMMRVFHVKPNVFVYTSLIKGLCEMGELDSAFKLKDEMLLDEKVGVDAAVYSPLIIALFRTGRKGEVVSILEEMKGNGCKPDTVTYNAIIAGFCNEKDFVSAFGVLDEMLEKGCKPDVFSYNTIIAGFCKGGRLREAIDLFEDMPRRECPPDVVSYRMIFDGLCDGMEFKEAALILDEMLFKGYAPRLLSVDKFVEGLCCEGDLELLGMVINSLLKGNAIHVDIWKMVVNSICVKSTKLNAFELVDRLRIQ
ncbi:putative pentatricopeptide repeat-containing protein [Cinnamomum micranthum f. kanehirae]|uniref:Putative pentatricopeptide repeat-containing protein n=1 Tax=Cinnamomum micranthum f. kanehirae TaxID=337451 RepID=A0A443P549_9MAGN|nr:putative pentatricopeptide repeat-containing protein [Cinnamomum micranthum f. kanehirae]